MCRSLHSALKIRKKVQFLQETKCDNPKMYPAKKNCTIFPFSSRALSMCKTEKFFLFFVFAEVVVVRAIAFSLSLNGDFVYTWNTVNMDCMKESKWLLDSLPDPALASVNFPPKICIPNKEKMKMKRNRITSKEFMDAMEFTSDFTKLPIEDQ